MSASDKLVHTPAVSPASKPRTALLPPVKRLPSALQHTLTVERQLYQRNDRPPVESMAVLQVTGRDAANTIGCVFAGGPCASQLIPGGRVTFGFIGV
jgi:hypothetical protein